MLDNQEIRVSIMKQRSLLTKQEVSEKSAQIINRCAPFCVTGKHIAIYRSIQQEVCLDTLYEQYHNQCYFYVPRIKEDDTMDFVEWSDTTLWRVGPFGIKEPKAGKVIKPEKLDLIFVPLVAFNEACDRLGHGKGYYDRYVKDCDATLIGVAYELQKHEGILSYAHDVRLDLILSEEKTYAQNHS